jgi:hypothetical protein
MGTRVGMQRESAFTYLIILRDSDAHSGAIADARLELEQEPRPPAMNLIDRAHVNRRPMTEQ